LHYHTLGEIRSIQSLNNLFKFQQFKFKAIKLLSISFVLFGRIVGNSLYAQELSELDLSIDNDLFSLTKDEDRYYSSGIFVSYRKVISPESGFYKKLNKKEKLINLIQGVHLKQLVFTSDLLDFTDIRFQDRPFAGTLSLGYSLDIYNSDNLYLSFNQDIGILGPASGTSDIHIWWHKKLNLVTPTSWEFQVKNRVLINSKIAILKSFNIVTDRIDFVYESKYEFGNVFSNIRQGGIFRVGKIQGLGSSGYKNGFPGQIFKDGNSKKLKEFYLFLGLGTEYVFYNHTIEGNFPGRMLAPINNLERWLFITKSGFNMHWNKLDIGWHFFFNTKENSKAVNHRYARIRLTKRF